jgi:hypothetical protein
MTAFDTAWDLVKMFSLNWRGVAEQLPLLGGGDYPPLSHEGKGSNMMVYQHPFDNRFVVKRPHSFQYQDDFDDPDSEDWAEFSNTSVEGRSLHDDFYAFMERLGYPIVGEMYARGANDETYTIQPRLIDAGSKDADFDEISLNDGDNPSAAQRALTYAFGDLTNPHNYMKDQLGNYRLIDLDPYRYGGFGAWFSDDEPHHAKNFGVDGRPAGEHFQEYLDRQGIQLPASRMLNEMDRVDYPDIHYRGALEALEPFSDNPNKVLVEGKPKWLEGLE